MINWLLDLLFLDKTKRSLVGNLSSTIISNTNHYNQFIKQKHLSTFKIESLEIQRIL